MPSKSFMGATIRRREDPRLITGASRYVDDIHLPQTAYMGFLRSPHAHARVTRLDLSAVRQHPAVLAAAHAGDVGFITDLLSEESEAAPEEAAGEEQGGGERPLLAKEIVRFAGEPVAVVVVNDRYATEDVLELIDVEFEPLAAYIDIERGDTDSADFPNVKPDKDDKPVGTVREFSHGNVDAAIDGADIVIQQRMVNQRLAPLPMETRAVLATYDSAREELIVYASTQCAHFVRDDLARLLKLPHSRVRVIAPEVGGGFGCKIGKYPEDILAAHFAIKLGRPIKWVESRTENFLSTVQGRSQIATITLAAMSDGRLVALDLDLLVDTGAYDAGWLGTTTSGMITGCYEIPNVRSRSRSIFTHKTPLGAYRGAGRPEAAYFIERAMDILAARLKVDPAELRRVNFVSPERFPYKAPDWPIFDSGDYRKSLDTALERVDYPALVARREEARRSGGFFGVGFATYVEVTGFGWETATLNLESDGSATVYTGISPHGQGQETTFAQIVADVCGISPADVRVTYGDTSLGSGRGTMGSRGTSVGGTALHRAAVDIREKMRLIAAEMIEAAPEDLELVDGNWSVKGSPDSFETVAAVAKAAYSESDLPEGMDPGLRADRSFTPEEVTAPFGTHCAVVEVCPDTGEVKIERLLTVDDCGTIISPQLVEGQVHGGVMQGLAQALYEEVVHDENGQLLTASFGSYAMPTIGESPHLCVTHTHTPSTRNELGVKGVGEAGSIGSTPAVVNAVVNALEPLGVTHLDMPLTPQRVWRAIQEARPVAISPSE